MVRLGHQIHAADETSARLTVAQALTRPLRRATLCRWTGFK
ncbi:hypothetical protein [Sphingopyxis terrae]|jgi:hypothetical protein